VEEVVQNVFVKFWEGLEGLAISGSVPAYYTRLFTMKASII
jgi:hypothetical protein